MSDRRCDQLVRTALCVILPLVLLALGAQYGRWSRGELSRSTLEVTERLITHRPIELLQETSLMKRVPVFVWSFAEEQDLAGWSLESRPDLRPVLSIQDGALSVPKSQSDLLHIHDLGLQAGDIDAIEVDLGDIVLGKTELAWARPGEAFSMDRHILVQSPTAERGGITFFVRGHPNWKGMIGRLAIRPTITSRQSIRIVRIAGVQFRSEPEMVDRGAEREWYVRIGSVVRSAVITRVERPTQWDFSVPEHARLRFAYAPPSVRGGEWRLLVIGETGESGREVLFEDSVDPPRDGDVPRWRDAELTLEQFAGKRIRLAFECQTDPRDERTLRAGFLGDPIIVAPAAKPPRPNVLLISIDTCRADHLSIYGYRRLTSPNLDSWVRGSGVVFRQAIASAPWTLPSHVSMMSGLNAHHHGVNIRGPIPNATRMLAEYFRDAGYRTFATTAGMLLDPAYGFHKGFDEYEVRVESEGAKQMDAELVMGVDRVCDWLRNRRSVPFFLFFHTYEPHTPFTPREPYFERFGGNGSSLPPVPMSLDPILSDGARGWLVGYRIVYPEHTRDGVTQPRRVVRESERDTAAALYDSSVAYTDSQIARIFHCLRQNGLAENTIIVVTSDHGESFFEHGQCGHSHLYDDNLRVPFLMSGPGIPRGMAVERQVRSVDILPSLIELTGLPPAEGIDGVSVVPILRGTEGPQPREAWSYCPTTGRGISLRSGDGWKFIACDSVAFRPHKDERYDLLADPDETRNLEQQSMTAPEFRARALKILDDALPAIRVTFTNETPTSLTGWIREPMASYLATTHAGLPADCVSWDSENARVQLTVPSGQSYTLLFQDRRAGRLSVGLSFGSEEGPSITQEVELSRFQPFALAFENGAWRLDPSGQQPKTGARIWDSGVLAGNGPAPEAPPPEFLEALKGLGYVQ